MEQSYVFPSNFAPRHFGSKKAKKLGKIGGSKISDIESAPVLAPKKAKKFGQT